MVVSLKRPAWGAVFWAVGAAVLLYAGALLWADARNDVFGRLPEVARWMPVLMALSLLSYLLRYLRWRWLLRGSTREPLPLVRGGLAYLSGFAFTTTPGKVGELLRVRYFAAMGVPPARVLAAFVFERACDLLTLSVLAALSIADRRLFAVVLAFVGMLLAVVVLLGLRPRTLAWLVLGLHRLRWRLLARSARVLRHGLADALRWLHPVDLAVALALGGLAWGLTCYAFVWLLDRMGAELSFLPALAVYPTAMLAGAASFLPGGIGTTEGATVALLSLQGVALGTAVLAAVAIRLAGLWFSVVLGLLSVAWLERPAPHEPVRT